MSIESHHPTGLLAAIPPTAPHDALATEQALHAVGQELVAARLPQLLPFNTIYGAVTTTVEDAIRQPDVFATPDIVSRMTGVFAEKYFAPLRSHALQDEGSIAAPWARLINDPATEVHDGIKFLYGMNVHINYDLPQSLSISGVGAEYYPDYTVQVGKIIQIIAHQLAPAYVGGFRASRYIKTVAAVAGIARWREQAWQAGMALQAEQDNEPATEQLMSKLEQRTTRNHLILAKLGRSGIM